MRKFVIMSFILMGIAELSAFADIPEPRWTNFCPSQYCSATQSEDAYWYGRRVRFEKQLSNCNKLEGTQKALCYDEMNADEMKKTQVWEIRTKQNR
ncbi:hypothetical protein IKQ26_08010 [bacterium]|nr:hypothetical protein [bacterium]